jgi:hypothetical protein
MAREGPGLAKARARFVERRTMELVRLRPAQLAALFADADVVSEGGVRLGETPTMYYGSTSLLVRPGSNEPALDLPTWARLLASDPHARLFALRVARREARRRAGELERLDAELVVTVTASGALVRLEVSAPVRAPARDVG